MKFLRTSPRGLSMRAGYIKSATAKISTTDQAHVSGYSSHEDGKHLTITGNELVFHQYGKGESPADMKGREYDAALYAAAKDAKGLSTLTIVADTISIERDIKLPGCNVSIFARRLKIAHKTGITTRAAEFVKSATDAFMVPDQSAAKKYRIEAAKDGQQGLRGGDISLFVETIQYAEGNTVALFSTAGGKGQDPGNGIPGSDGDISYGWEVHEKRPSGRGTSDDNTPDSIKSYLQGSNSDDEPGSRDVKKLQDLASNENFTIVGLKVRQRYEPRFNRAGDFISNGEWWASPKPGDGVDAYAAPGGPGIGGDAGDFIYWKSIKNLTRTQLIDDGFVAVSAGPGADPKVASGGEPGWGFHPSKKHKFDVDSQKPTIAGELPTSVEMRFYTLTRGPYADGLLRRRAKVEDWNDYRVEQTAAGSALRSPASEGQGKKGDIRADNRAAGWFHRDHLNLYRGYLDQMMLFGSREEIARWVGDLRQAIEPMGTAGELHQSDDPHMVSLSIFQRYLEGLSGKLAAHIDGFGHPAGWAPATSLISELDNYAATVDMALEMAFAASFYTLLDNHLHLRIAAASRGISALQKQRKLASAELKSLGKELASLNGQAIDCLDEIESLVADLAEREETLRDRIETEVRIKLALDLAANVMKVIPVYQPELGFAGDILKSGSSLLTKPPSEITGADVLQKVLSAGVKGGELGLDTKLSALQESVDNADNAADALEAKKFIRSKDRKQFLAKNKKDADALREGVAQQRKSAKTLSKIQSGLDENGDDIVSDVKGLFYPKQEVDALIDQFEAADEVFQALAHRLRVHKEKLANTVPRILHIWAEVNSIQALIAAAHDNEAQLYDSLVYSAERALPNSVLTVAQSLKASAVRGLIKQRYLLVKAYENLFLETLEPETLDVDNNAGAVPPLDVRALFDVIEANVSAALSSSGDPGNPDDWSAEREQRVYQAFASATRPLLNNTRKRIAEAIQSKAVDGGANNVFGVNPTVVRLELNAAQLEALNTGPYHQVYVDLTRVAGMELEKDRCVIGEIEVKEVHFKTDSIDADLVRSDGDSLAPESLLPKFSIVHNGSGVFKSRNTLWQIRYGNHAAVQTWNFQVDLSDPSEQKLIETNSKQIEESRDQLLNASRKALSIDGESGDGVASYFTALPAYTELQVLLEHLAHVGAATIDKLVLYITVFAANDNASTLALDVSVAGDSQDFDADSPIPIEVSLDDGKSWFGYSLPLFLPTEDGATVALRSLKDRNLSGYGLIGIDNSDNDEEPVSFRDGVWTLKMQKLSGRSYIRQVLASIGPVAVDQ